MSNDLTSSKVNLVEANTDIAIYTHTDIKTRTHVRITRSRAFELIHHVSNNVTREAIHDAVRTATEYAAANDMIDSTDYLVRGGMDPMVDPVQNQFNATNRSVTEGLSEGVKSASTWSTTSQSADLVGPDTTMRTDLVTRNTVGVLSRPSLRRSTLDAVYEAIEDKTMEEDKTNTQNIEGITAPKKPPLDPAAEAARACFELAGKKGLEYANRWSSVYQGGAYWGYYDCYLTAFRDVLGLDLPVYKKYDAWERAAIHGTFRVMHPDFCIVSDFPEILRVDGENRPHCENGPSHRWRDGWELYHWHGVKIPNEWLRDKSLDAKTALQWPNIEQRRAACEIVGWPKILSELKAVEIDADGDPEIGTLVEVDLPDSGKERFLRVQCGTLRQFAIPVPREMKTAVQAQAWTWGLDLKDFVKPEVRT